MSALAVLAGAAALLHGATDQGGPVTVSPAGSRVTVQWQARCASGAWIGSHTNLFLAPGRRRRVVERQRFDDGGSAVIVTVARAGGDGRHGTWHTTVRFFDSSGGPTDTCSTGPTSWRAGRVPGLGTRRWTGRSTQAVALHAAAVAPGRARLTLGWTVLCPSGRWLGFKNAFQAGVLPDGRLRVRRGRRSPDEIGGGTFEASIALSARIGPRRLAGTLRATVVVRDSAGARVETCRTPQIGVRAWS